MNYISVNPYKFDEEQGTFTLTSEQKVALNNSSMIRVGFKLLFKEYDYSTTTTTKISEKVEYDETTGEATITTTYETVEKYLGTWRFENDEYKLTFTSTSYTLEKK